MRDALARWIAQYDSTDAQDVRAARNFVKAFDTYFECERFVRCLVVTFAYRTPVFAFWACRSVVTFVCETMFAFACTVLYPLFSSPPPGCQTVLHFSLETA